MCLGFEVLKGVLRVLGAFRVLRVLRAEQREEVSRKVVGLMLGKGFVCRI